MCDGEDRQPYVYEGGIREDEEVEPIKETKMDSGKIIRRVALYFTMIPAAVFCGILWYGFSKEPLMIVPAVGFTGVYVWFIGMEIWGVTTGNKKTLSKRLTAWIEENKVLGLTAVGLFGLSMIALCVHFAVYW